MPTTTNNTTPIRLQPVESQMVEVRIQGITPLITHCWSEKAKKMMRDKQTGKTKKAANKEPKVIADELEGATYRLPDGRAGLPAVAIKAAMVGAARMYDGVTMTELRRMIFVRGQGPDQLLPIIGESAMREDTVRVGMAQTDLRYRPQWEQWEIDLTIEYAARLDTESVLNLLATAGRYEGVGEWRPSSPKAATGTYGRFEISKAY